MPRKKTAKKKAAKKVDVPFIKSEQVEFAGLLLPSQVVAAMQTTRSLLIRMYVEQTDNAEAAELAKLVASFIDLRNLYNDAINDMREEAELHEEQETDASEGGHYGNALVNKAKRQALEWAVGHMERVGKAGGAL